MKCDICGREEVEWICVQCDSKMVCSDCDQKWHQHPRRSSHKRERLQSSKSTFINGVTSSLPTSGSYTRTSAPTNSIGDGSEPETYTVGKSLVRDEDSNVAYASNMPTFLAENEPLVTRGLSASDKTAEPLLPQTVAEINQDLSLQSLFGANNSLVSENSSAGLTSHQNNGPDVVQRSNSRQFNSLTSDFQSMLQSLQSVMKEVNNSMMAGNGKGASQNMDLENWSIPSEVNRQTEMLKSSAGSEVSSNHSSPTSMSFTKHESSRMAARNDSKTHDAIDDELASLLAKTKYPPSVGTSVSPIPSPFELTKPVTSKKATEDVNLEHTGSESPILHDLTPNMKGRHTVDFRDSTTTPANMPRTSNELPLTGIHTKIPVEHELPIHSKNNVGWTDTHSRSALSVQSGLQSTIDRQKSETFLKQHMDRQKSETSLKQRMDDSPGVVYPRVGNGKNLGVLERPAGAGSEPAYHSKFTQIHDEVQQCIMHYVLFRDVNALQTFPFPSSPFLLSSLPLSAYPFNSARGLGTVGFCYGKKYFCEDSEKKTGNSWQKLGKV